MMALLALPGIGFQLPANATEWAYLLASGIFGFIFVSLHKAAAISLSEVKPEKGPAHNAEPN